MKKITTLLLTGTLLGYSASAQTLDNDFGANGIVINQSLGPIRALAIQSDDKIVAAGAALSNALYHFQIARYNSDGSLDNSFGSNGSVTTEIGFSSRASSVAIQSDGKIVAAGTYDTGDFTNIYHAAIVRYKANGNLDSSFGINGIVMAELDFSESVNDLIIQGDGKIVIGGGITTLTQIAVQQFMLARYNVDGTLDDSYGHNGIARTTISTYSVINDIILQPDGKIIAAGQEGAPSLIGFPDDVNFAIARFDTNGSLDPGFGTSGFVTTNVVLAVPDLISSIALQADGKILAAGTSGDSVAMVRYNADGSLDQSFGNGGRSIHSGYATPLALLITAEDKIITAATLPYDIEDGGDFLTTRYLGDGSLDNSFGMDGAIITNLGGTRTDFASCLILQPDGKLIVAGSSNDGAGMVRYTLSGGTSVGDMILEDKGIGVYPNPFSETINIDWKGSNKKMNVEVQIVDIIGRTNYSVKVVLQPGKNELQLPNLPAGNHIFIISNEQGKRWIKKITKH